MTRYRRKRIAAAVRICALLMLPFGAAGAAKGFTFLRSAVEKMDSITVGAPVGDTRTSAQSSVDRGNSVDRTALDELMLSFGYGYEVEEEIIPDLESPLDMTAEDAGPKPYPTADQWTEGDLVVRTTYGKYGGDQFFDLDKCGQVNNKSSIPNSELKAESKKFPAFTIADTDEPQVLIYHTHTTESFEPFVREHMDAEFNYRTTDPTKNMVMVGNAIQAELEAQGIGVIHVTEIHDYPSYNGSYGRSRESIIPVLEQYPSIKVALDIHRDAISGDGTAAQPFIEVDSKEAAQIMIISGCDDGTLDMPNYLMNFRFACKLQQQLEGDNPGFTRPILFDYRHYNQDLTTGSLLIEVGSHGNTLDQVQYSGTLIGKSLGKLLNSMKEDE